MKSDLYIVENTDDLNKLISHCKRTGYCCFDFETTSTEYYRESEYPTALAVSFQPGGSWVIPLKHKESAFSKKFKKVLRKFGKEVLENEKIVKIAWNLQFELKWCFKYQIYPKGRLFDAMLAKYLLDETRPNDLKSMVTKYLPEFSQYEHEIENVVKKYGWANVPLDILCKYAGLDADLEFRLFLMFEERLIKKGFYKIFRNLLMMGARVLAESSYHGFPINVEKLYEVRDLYKEKIDNCLLALQDHKQIRKYEKLRIKEAKKNYIKELKREIKSLTDEDYLGNLRKIQNREQKINNIIFEQNLSKKDQAIFAPFNFGSPDQLKKLLFLSPYGFEFDIIKYTTDKYNNETDNPSTDEEVLNKLNKRDDTGFIDLLLEYRGLLHIRNNFIDSFIEKMYNGKLHPSYLIHGTVSGRLSSRNPNAQQIPRITTNPYIKRLFVPSPNKILMQVDYSQAELRVLAAMAKEKTMLKWFKEGRDIHLASAVKKYREDYDKIYKIYKDENHPENIEWSKRRKQAKTINFGIVYGQGAKHLSESLSTDDYAVSQEEAQKFLDEFFRDFPRIKKFIKSQHRKAKTDGFVTSPFGRKRRLPEIHSPNWGKKAEAQRQSVNAIVQGTASDYTLFASILIWEAVKKGELPMGLKQLATVHDSLIYELYPEDVHTVIPIINKICQDPETEKWFGFKLKGIAMAVDFELGSNWGDLSNYQWDKDCSSLVNSDTIYN